MRLPPSVLLAVVVLAVCVTAAGCAGGGSSPGVANLGSPGTTTSDSQENGSTGGGPAAGGGGPQRGFALRMNTGGSAADASKFSRCMRSHGVPNFPDPNAQGGITVTSASGIDPSSPAFQSAQTRCRKLLPNGGRPSAQQVAQARRAALRYSACMRAHGVHDFPDPTFRGGGVQLKLGGGRGSDLDPGSPTFQSAQKACQGDLPGLKGGG